MPSNKRADNQYYGKYRECCVVACLNKTEVEFNENYNFTEEEKQELYSQAKLIADYLGEEHTAQYTGNYTKNTSGDILLDNKESVEIKTVSNGNGTYFNTSIYYFTKFGFDFKDYMEKYGLYKVLKENFENIVTISTKNNSPISQKDSSYIRHNFQSIYENNIVPIDEMIREEFTKDIANYFLTHVDRVYEFIIDMLEKNTQTSQKSSPDRLIVLNYQKGIVKEINLKHFKDNISNNIRSTPKGLVIGNIRVALSWQNGIGLNNPTIRVYLEEE